VSRLSDLLRQVEQKDPQLAEDLAREVKEMRQRRPFGLNFERHLPETVELYGRPIRKGDKVRFLPARGEAPKSVDRKLWKVVGVARKDGERVAKLLPAEPTGAESVAVERVVADLAVVAEFRDPIYPGLASTGKVQRGGDKPFHTVINAENFHALQLLLYTHEGKVDAIYIDPPYNTGAKDWKYNNDYIDADDVYRHSKWLAFMERRLKLARRLLNPAGSALIVTIDEKEYLRLGILLEQTFPDARIQMVSSVINPAGTGRQNEFSRTNEYILFARIGDLAIQPMLATDASSVAVEWEPFRRRDLQSRRGSPKGGRAQFYPIYVDLESARIVGTGEPLPPDQDRSTATVQEGCASVFPVRENGTEMNWSLTRDEFERRLAGGYVRVGRHQPDGPQEYVVSYLRTGPIADIEAGRAMVVGRNPDGSVIANYPEGKQRMPLTQWDFASHDAQRYGTTLIQAFTPGRRFPFPKSLYAVEDVLRIAMAHKPHGVVVDFFAGSGTTPHAVMRLNRQDGGGRRSISVTNNEVAADEQRSLLLRGLRPAEPDWEALGICEWVTKPRITAAVTGRTPEGEIVEGDYRFTDEFPMADGFEENVEFLTMTYEAPRAVAHHRSFEAIAPLLWLKAGALGSRIDKPTDNFAVADAYAVLFDTDCSGEFLTALQDADGARTVFVVTDDDRAFQMVCAELPAGVEAVRLYSSYLTNFAINTGRD